MLLFDVKGKSTKKKSRYAFFIFDKVGCVFSMVVVTIQYRLYYPGPNYHREHAPHFITTLHFRTSGAYLGINMKDSRHSIAVQFLVQKKVSVSYVEFASQMHFWSRVEIWIKSGHSNILKVDQNCNLTGDHKFWR